MKRMDNETKERIKNIVSELLQIDPDRILMDSRIREDLDADSLDMYELQYMLEDELGIDIPDDLASKVNTVADFVNWYEEQS